MQLWAILIGFVVVAAVAYPGADKPQQSAAEAIHVEEVHQPTDEPQESGGEDAVNPLDESPPEKVSYKGSQLWKVVVDDDVKRSIIGTLKKKKVLSTWGGNTTAIDVLVKPGALDIVAGEFKRAAMNYEVIISDLQRAIDTENPAIIEEELEDRKGHKMTWQMYHRFSDIDSYLTYLAQTYPSICSVRVIGNSVEQRPIKVLKLSNGNAGNKAVWVDGGIHAREWITPATVTNILNQFVENWETESETVKSIDWYFAPLLNPDGYEYSHTTDRLWRKNRRAGIGCQGTDLNRNFGYRWGGRGSSKNPCQETYGGAGAFSEPETAAVQRFITSTAADWKAYVSFHSYGQYILFPWGYDKVVPPDYQDLQSVGNKAAAAIREANGQSYTVGPAGNTLYPAAGGSDDWAKGTAKIKYAYTVELRDTGRYGFILPSWFIEPTAKEALAALRVFAAAAAAA